MWADLYAGLLLVALLLTLSTAAALVLPKFWPPEWNSFVLWISTFGGALTVLSATLAGILHYVTDHRPGLKNGMPGAAFFSEHTAVLVLAGAGVATLLVGRSRLNRNR